jgi:hypothetical protein
MSYSNYNSGYNNSNVATNAMTNIQNVASNAVSNISNVATNLASGISNTASGVSASVSNASVAMGDKFKGFSSNYKATTREFFDSNSLVAKVAFLLLVLVGFTFLLRLGIWLIGSFLIASASNPRLLNGMISAKTKMIIPQDTKMPNAINIPRSDNEREGVEFTWSCWIFINDLEYKNGMYKCVFYKGNDFKNSSIQPVDTGADTTLVGVNFPNNAPGLYIDKNTNNLIIFMNTFNDINTKVTVNEIPMNKWINVIIRCKNTLLDVYINGDISKSLQLNGVPKQNYGDVYVAENGGFDGYISNLWYYDHALNPIEISNLVYQGPNTNMIGTNNAMGIKNNDYLSLRWYFAGESGGYRP